MIITARIAVPASTTAAAVLNSLSSNLSTAVAASNALGLEVQSDPTTTIYASPPALPPAPPPPAPPSPTSPPLPASQPLGPRESTEETNPTGADGPPTWLLVSLGGVVCCCFSLLLLALARRHRQAKTVEVQLSSSLTSLPTSALSRADVTLTTHPVLHPAAADESDNLDALDALHV